MATFPLAVWENLLNTTLDWFVDKGDVHIQSIHKRPFYDWVMSRPETFPGSKEFLTLRVQGEFGTYIQGFSGDQTVGYSNPANVKVSSWPYKRIHAGLSFTMDELIRNGIGVSDTTTGEGDSVHSKAEQLQLVNLLKNKAMDMKQGMANDMNSMFWLDGTQDSSLVPGLRSIIVDDPTTASVIGGIDQSANTWWRNRASLSIDSSTPSDLNLLTALDAELVQLSKFNARPDKAFCGSDFLQAMKKEQRASGYLTMTGFQGKNDGGFGNMSNHETVYHSGIPFTYDPTLDDMSRSKYAYVLDSKHLRPMVVQGENMKKHNPARPPDKYVFYRAVTWVGGLVCDQRNCHGVYSIA